MRSELQMMDLILNTAQNDDRIRAVILNGSRANPNAPKDFFQDFDIVYVVRQIETFTSNHSWIDIFGERMILQIPKLMDPIPDKKDQSITYLMQFMDGNRIDLTLVPYEDANQMIERESQSILLIDKDGIIEPFPPASDADFVVKRPTGKEFYHCCNEFWWINPYVAKGIWRDELPYAMYTYDRYARDMLMKMIGWYIGLKTGFSVSGGKHGKYYKKYLKPYIWEMYVKTYTDGSYNSLWNSLFISGELFRTLAQEVARNFGYEYPYKDDERVTAHLRHVKSLPRDAVEMYE